MTQLTVESENPDENVFIAEQSDGSLCDTYHTKMCAVVIKRLEHTDKPTVLNPVSEVEQKRRCGLCEDIDKP